MGGGLSNNTKALENPANIGGARNPIVLLCPFVPLEIFQSSSMAFHICPMKCIVHFLQLPFRTVWKRQL